MFDNWEALERSQLAIDIGAGSGRLFLIVAHCGVKR